MSKHYKNYNRGARPCTEESPDDLGKNHQIKVDAHLVM